ncbi:MAG: glycosyltransferase [Lachnospiraceae bacterium]|nr:glycosyltransferase [Lachnospiraceae bacterium]
MEKRADDSTELISVIVPIYKVEKYLRECVDSILRQTYSSLEIILVDDGSPDRCGKIADEYASKDPRVKVIHRENGGLSEARNSGLREATGIWVVFVDSDDVIHEKMISALYDAAVSTDSRMAWCAICEISEDGYPIASEDRNDGTLSPNKKVDGREKTGECSVSVLTGQEAEKQLYTMSGNQQCLVAWNKLYHKDCFYENGELVFYPPGKIFEDGYTTYRLIYQAKRIAVLSQPLYYYRQREGSIMAKNAYRIYEPALEAGLLRMDFYKSHGEKELYLMELNMTIYSVIRFYARIPVRKERKNLRRWFGKIYRDYFVKEHWPLAKRIRMKAFQIGYPCYRLVSSFESLYNRLRHSTKMH